MIELVKQNLSFIVAYRHEAVARAEIDAFYSTEGSLVGGPIAEDSARRKVDCVAEAWGHSNRMHGGVGREDYLTLACPSAARRLSP